MLAAESSILHSQFSISEREEFMKAPDFYLNNYIADELRAAFDKEDVCISYSGDYEPETLNQVHNSCEILFVEEGEADQEMYKEKMASQVGRE